VRRAIVALFTVFLPFTFAHAQGRQQQRNNPPGQTSTSTAKKAKRGPRAIGVLEFLPNGAMRLVPIALWIEGKYYDASLYGANPEPMAIEPQTVYEAQSLGEPTGTFTITEPKQVNGNWAADGTWRPELPMDAKAAAQAAAKSKTSGKVVLTGDADDGRPVLKRAPGSSSQDSTQPPAQPTSTIDSDRPVMKKPPPDSSSKPTMGTPDAPPTTGSSTTTTKTQTTTTDNDPDRPVFSRPAPAAPSSDTSGTTAITPSAAASNDNDPNRPVLSRTKTTKPAPVADIDSAPTKPGAAKSAAVKVSRAYPAISDAGHYETRSLLYSFTSGERQVQEQQMLKTAMAEIQAFAAKHSGPPIPKTATITDYEVRAFDLAFSNSPTVVLTAKLPVPPAKGQHDTSFIYYVALVARVDINDQAQKIFSSVTDSTRLDAFPRMELIDAVDADANGRGDLLFRQYSDVGISYGLYRVSPYQIEKVFEGGSSL